MDFCVMIVLLLIALALRTPTRHILYIISGDDLGGTGVTQVPIRCINLHIILDK